MKKRFFTSLMFAAFIGAGMVSVTSCADYDADLNQLQQQITTGMTQSETVQTQIEGINDAIEKLEQALEGAGNCDCGERDIEQEIAQYLATHGFLTQTEINQAIEAALQNVNSCDCEAKDIEQEIANYLSTHGYLTQTEINQYILDAINAHLSSADHLTESDLAQYLNTHGYLTQAEINQYIVDAITQHLADANHMSESEVTGIVNTAIASSQIIKDLQDAIALLKSCTCDPDVLQEIKDAIAGIKDCECDLDALETKLNIAITAAKNKADDAYSIASTNAIAITGLNTAVTTINETLVTLTETATNALNRANEAYSKADTNEQTLITLDSLYQALATAVAEKDSLLGAQIQEIADSLNDYATKDEVQQQITETKEYADSLLNLAKQYAEEKDSTLREELIQQFNDSIDSLEARVAKNEEDIKKLAKVTDYVTHLITNIELQGTKNPAFGYFALPVGVTNNILVAYYGKNAHLTQFPAIEDKDLVYDEEANWITEEDAARIGLLSKQKSWNGGSIFTNDKGNAGKLYLTINPSSVDFTGTEFSLVNSLGEESPVTLEAVTPCNDLLKFGVTRSTVTSNANNGFYEALATVKPANINKTNISLNDNLVDALKDVYKNKQNANFSDLAKALYQEVASLPLDAYAVQAKFNGIEDGTESTVTSRYGIAAAALQPLSYNTLYGKHLGKLPTITPLSERNINLNDYIKVPNFDFDFEGITLDEEKMKVEIHFSDVWVEDDGSIWTNVHMKEKYISSTGEISTSYEQLDKDEKFCLVSADGTFNGPIYDYEEGINPGIYAGLDEYQRRAINAMIALIVEDRAQVWSAQLQEGFSKQLAGSLTDLVSKINATVDDVSAQIKGQLSGAINDMINDLNSQLNSALGKTDRFVNLLNKLTGKINDQLNNINARLQPVLVYEGADGGLHPMSTKKGIPSILSGNGAIQLDLTSWTGEIAAPAYKKFVAVTNVYKNGKDADNSAELKSALDAANGGEFFNQVITGDRFGVAFQPKAGLKDATYEIVYSALDFHGNISQRKYYVKVK